MSPKERIFIRVFVNIMNFAKICYLRYVLRVVAEGCNKVSDLHRIETTKNFPRWDAFSSIVNPRGYCVLAAVVFSSKLRQFNCYGCWFNIVGADSAVLTLQQRNMLEHAKNLPQKHYSSNVTFSGAA